MPTNETYEIGAKNLAERIKTTQNLSEKAKIMTYLGNLRYSQYESTREPRARQLAGNCYIAAKYLNHRAIVEKLN